MSVDELASELRGDARFMATVAAWRVLPAQAARMGPLPQTLDPALVAALQQRGIAALYTHQGQAVEHALAGANVAVVTPTASGKTLCYNLPVFHTLLGDPAARALYLFPTKALAQDQLAELHALAARRHESRRRVTQSQPSRPSPVAPRPSPSPPTTATRPPPTAPASARRRACSSPTRTCSTWATPYHTQWADYLAGLRWVVIDEMHSYRGVFGSQVAAVLRRLRRLCAHYGSAPQFICTSATIANPQALAERLVEAPVTLVDENGTPRGVKHIILVNPPLLDAEKGIRRSPTLEATDLATRCLARRPADHHLRPLPPDDGAVADLFA